MAITAINIIQDNKVGSSNLVSIHSRLVFLVDVTYTGLSPEIINVDLIYQTVVLETYRCIFLSDVSTTERRFAFIANSPVKALMDDFDDSIQLVNTFVSVPKFTKLLTLDFYDPDVPATNDTVEINFLHAVSQFGTSPNQADIYNNVSNTYYAKKDNYVYVYFLNSGSDNIDVIVNSVSIGITSATEPGYYRLKLLANEDKTVVFDPDLSPTTGAFYVTLVDECTEGKVLKYLDSKGQYRFYPFNKFYETKDNPKIIGSTNKFITNILSDQSDTSNVGFKNERQISISAEVPNERLEVVTDLYTSPRVYLYIGSGTDTAADWLEVTIQVSDAIVRRRKYNFGTVDLTIKLPEHYTIKMI